MGKKSLLLTTVLVVLLLSGCSSQKEERMLSGVEQTFVYEKTREKPFGELEYMNISEKEALELMKDKFDVAVPDVFDTYKKLGSEQMESEKMPLVSTNYSVYSQGDELYFYGEKAYGEKADPLLYDTIEFKYNFDRVKKKVVLTNMWISIYNLPMEDGGYRGKNLQQTLELLGSYLQIDDEENFSNFEKVANVPMKNRKNKTIPFFDNRQTAEQEKGLRRAVLVKYGEDGSLVKIMAGFQDLQLVAEEEETSKSE
ncbi:hypothetical protein [Candidatus Enterococcus mansonii]|uniref:Uncharacterized protein n=1 Tax=Candidatus Enterococcus mansonii TaxID=1834181 RepID=A0A242CCZ8_9ENTE|nr:hypothetical protein [Enterococcus sp. 4G2_DIV0659]OTO08081.1 hypothetical protein A5880_002351 [Enterococcus sp. 4G2_DIV0659]